MSGDSMYSIKDLVPDIGTLHATVRHGEHYDVVSTVAFPSAILMCYCCLSDKIGPSIPSSSACIFIRQSGIIYSPATK